jgi:hypothetical protein
LKANEDEGDNEGVSRKEKRMKTKEEREKRLNKIKTLG